MMRADQPHLRILWVCGSPILGGAEQASLQIAELLRQRGHTIHVLHRRGSPLLQQLKRADLPAHSAPLGALDPRAPRAISKAVRATSPDAVLVTSIHEWVWACLSKRCWRTTPLVLVRHMVVPVSWRVRWLANRNADAIVAVSHAVRRSLLGGAGIRPDRLHVIHNPVRFAIRANLPSADDRIEARNSLRLPPGDRWVGFFGGLDPAKGIGDVLRVLREINRTVGPTHLLVCGREGHQRDLPAARALVQELRLEDRFHYLGFIDAVEQAMTATDAVVMATTKSLGEGMPLTIMEAMACGTPVVAYRVGGTAEVIGKDGAAGRLVEPDNQEALASALAEVLSSPQRARDLATKALLRARDVFDPDQIANAYERLFLDLHSPSAPTETDTAVRRRAKGEPGP